MDGFHILFICIVFIFFSIYLFIDQFICLVIDICFQLLDHTFIHSFIHLLIYIFKSSFYFLLSLHDYYPESRLFSDLLIHIRTLYFPSLPCSLFSDSNSNGKWRSGAEKSKKNIFSEIQKLWLNECPELDHCIFFLCLLSVLFPHILSSPILSYPIMS